MVHSYDQIACVRHSCLRDVHGWARSGKCTSVAGTKVVQYPGWIVSDLLRQVRHDDDSDTFHFRSTFQSLGVVGWAQMMGERVYLPTEPDRIHPAVGSSEKSAVGVENVAVVNHFRKARGAVEPLSLNLGNGMRIVGKFARRCPTDGAVTPGAIPELADYFVEIDRTALDSFREQASAGAGIPQCARSVDERTR